MILVLDYGIGNLPSFTKAIQHLSLPFTVSTNPDDIKNAERVVLIGVGNFGTGMEELTKRGFDRAIRAYVEKPNARLFGICVGMQLLFEGSEEAPEATGFGFFTGKLEKLVPQPDAPVPHVGFDEIHFATGSRMVEGLPDGASFYFTHSYGVKSVPNNCWVATCNHGSTPFVAAIDDGRICGVQFHPEKSQSNGIALLRNILGS